MPAGSAMVTGCGENKKGGVYYPVILDGGMRGVAFVEAATESEASYFFQKQYAGQFSTIKSIEKIG